MQNNRLGCLTGTGLITLLLTLAVITGVAFARGGVLFNPGPLNAQTGQMLGGVTSHAEIGGKCEACHTAPWETATMADRCVVCHGDIARQMQNMVTLHGVMYQNNPKLECRHCHPEHKGPQAPLTVVQGSRFPHELLGFSLNGHQFKVRNEPFVCADCHGSDLASFDPATCQNCHQQKDPVFAQAHAINYGTDCLACHDGVDRFGKNFSHAGFAFRLEGKHTSVDCAQCHTNARAVADFKSAPTDCVGCHQKDEPHQGRFGSDCAACHSVQGWKPAKFDHNLAAFKLEGKHTRVACEQCHVNGVFRGTPMDCFSCHRQDDHHNGQFGTQCEACHNPSSWENVTFDHSRSAFPLTGSHVNVACEKCHQNGSFKGTPTFCYACHKQDDHHNGRFGTQCEACHNPSSWDNVTFDHNRSRFPLTGAHAGLACERCHSQGQFTGLSPNCAACHGDPQFHRGAFGTNCAACHQTSAWRPAKFSGPHPGIANEGGSGIHHGGASCRTCHTATVYQATCTACHKGNPGGDGGGGGGGD